jgi:hypothetical protein
MMEKQEFDFEIPIDLLREFKIEPRIKWRYPWPLGIPVPYLLDERIRKGLDKHGLEVMIVPKMEGLIK